MQLAAHLEFSHARHGEDRAGVAIALHAGGQAQPLEFRPQIDAGRQVPLRRQADARLCHGAPGEKP